MSRWKGWSASLAAARWRLRMVAVAAGLATAMLATILGSGQYRLLASPPRDPQGIAQPGTFRPTAAQLASLRILPVAPATFRSEHVTEGNIAIDEDRTTPVFSPYSGRVVRLFARLGDQVEPGTPLAAVEASEFVQAQSELSAALAASRTARSQLTQAQTTEKRAHELYLAKGGALKDWQQAQTDLATAQNTLRTAEASLSAVRNRLRIFGKTDAEIAQIEAQPSQKLDPTAVVVAPIAGTVTQRQVGLGQYIQTGAANPIYTIADLSSVWLIANVREADSALVRIGTPVQVAVRAYPGRVFTARISWIAPGIDPNTRRLAVRAQVDNPDFALKPMMFARFSIVTGEPATMPAVPAAAVVYEGGEARLWVALDDGSLAARPVVTGRSENGLVEIVSGLAVGERVVTSGSLFLDRATSGD